MGSSKKVTVGYKYYVGMHLALCHGPVDAIREIQVDEKVAWSGAQADGSIYINKPNLFGGEKREGGISGTVDFEPGGPAQTANDYLTAKLPNGLVPAFRGVCCAVLRQVYVGLNPYLKTWAFRVQRIHTSHAGEEQWYDSKSEIVVVESTINDDFNFPGTSAYTDASNGVVINCEATDIIVIRKRANATYKAWSDWDHDAVPNAGGLPWTNRFEVTTAESVTTEYWPTYYATESEAEDAALNEDVILTGSTSYTIWLYDTPWTDNRGGLALEIYQGGHSDMNPAHILRECLLDPIWGMGYQAADIDDDSFTAAADTLYAEGFGLSLLWDGQSTIEEFISEVIRHIDAALYVDRTTGKFVLKLIRNDYDEETILELGPDEIIKVENYTRPAFGELTNSITVNYEAASGDTDTIGAQDPALVQMQGAVVGTTVKYPGISNQVLAARVAERDLRALSIPFLSCTIYANRTAASLNIGDVFKFVYPDYHDGYIVMRVIGLALGNGRSNQIKITCAQDVFSIANTATASQPTIEWADPKQEPDDSPLNIVVEAPYYELVMSQGQDAIDDALADDPDLAYFLAAAVRGDNAINAALYVDNGSGYEDVGIVDFAPSAVLSAAADYLDTTLYIEDGQDLDQITEGGFAQIDDELVRIDAVDETAGTITVGRGVLDTTPATHEAGAYFVAWDGYATSDETEYATAETVNVKILPVSGVGMVDISDAVANQATMDQRAYRPYPPAQLKFNDEYFPDEIAVDSSGDFVLTWVPRNRIQQTGGELLDFTDDATTAETGTTYTLEVLDATTLERQLLVEDIATTGYTLTDTDFADMESILLFKLWSERDGLLSWQPARAMMNNPYSTITWQDWSGVWSFTTEA